MLISSKSVHPDMDKSAMNTGIGLWIDHRKAVAVEIKPEMQAIVDEVIGSFLLSCDRPKP